MIDDPRSLALLNVGLRATGGEVAYHLAHKLADNDQRVLIVDCDFEAGVTERFLGESGLFDAWTNDEPSLEPIEISERLFLVPGDPRLALPRRSAKDVTFRVEFEERIGEAARHNRCSWILFSLGATLAALSESALAAAGAVAVVVGSQPRSLRALAVAGELFRRALPAKAGTEAPSLIGYIVQHPLQKVFGPAEIYAACLARLPGAYRTAFGLRSRSLPLRPAEDPYCLGLIERPAGLYELANEVGKPAFQLRSADGASESLLHAALETYDVYARLADNLAGRFPPVVSS